MTDDYSHQSFTNMKELKVEDYDASSVRSDSTDTRTLGVLLDEHVELACATCLSLFCEPYSLPCGHFFCGVSLIQTVALAPDGRAARCVGFPSASQSSAHTLTRIFRLRSTRFLPGCRAGLGLPDRWSCFGIGRGLLGVCFSQGDSKLVPEGP